MRRVISLGEARRRAGIQSYRLWCKKEQHMVRSGRSGGSSPLLQASALSMEGTTTNSVHVMDPYGTQMNPRPYLP